MALSALWQRLRFIVNFILVSSFHPTTNVWGNEFLDLSQPVWEKQGAWRGGKQKRISWQWEGKTNPNREREIQIHKKRKIFSLFLVALLNPCSLVRIHSCLRHVWSECLTSGGTPGHTEESLLHPPKASCSVWWPTNAPIHLPDTEDRRRDSVGPETRKQVRSTAVNKCWAWAYLRISAYQRNHGSLCWKYLLLYLLDLLALKVLQQLWARTSVKFENPTWQRQMWQTWQTWQMWQVGTRVCASSNGPPGKLEVGVRPVFLDPFLCEKNTHTFNFQHFP